jgi:hypothetical protein
MPHSLPMARRATYRNPQWRYDAQCVYCKQEHEGLRGEVLEWCEGACSDPRTASHLASPSPVFLDEPSFRCIYCGMGYGRIVGGVATEVACDQCVAEEKTTGPSKLSVAPRSPCGAHAQYGVQDLFGNSYGHPWRRYLFRGESWGCCLPTRTYNTLDGSEFSTCRKRAAYHVALPTGMVMPRSADGGQCGTACARHALVLAEQGATLQALE